jgi:hypothetical protein
MTHSRRPRRDADELIVIAAAVGQNHREIAGHAGVAVNTVLRRLDEPEIQTRIRARRNELAANLTAALVADAHAARQYLVSVMDDETISPGTRVRAATTLLAETRAWRDNEIGEQLRILNEALTTTPGRITLHM